MNHESLFYKTPFSSSLETLPIVPFIYPACGWLRQKKGNCSNNKHFLCLFPNTCIKNTKIFRKIFCVAEQTYYLCIKLRNMRVISFSKKTFNTVDYVGNDRYVFDIKDNNYRIAAIVIFINKKVYMRFVGTHEQYNRIKNIKSI